jgi:hypothetical protein
MNPLLRKRAFTGGALAGLLVPLLCSLAAWALAGSVVRAMLAITVAALLNLPAPLGGGMGMQGAFRVRWMRWEWTFDSDRSLSEAAGGAFLLSAVTTGGFFIAAPVLGVLLRWAGPFRTGLDEVLTLGAVVLVVGVAAVLHRPELSLRSLRSRLEKEGAQARPEELAQIMKRLAGMTRPEGGIGHVGGIGARTVGLHEHLDAEALLRLAAERDTPGAAALHARCLDYLLSRADPEGGFSAYPSGLARVEYTARALEALGGHLEEPAVLRHRAALQACCRDDGRFGRSATAPASDDATAWARRALVGMVDR